MTDLHCECSYRRADSLRDSASVECLFSMNPSCPVPLGARRQPPNARRTPLLVEPLETSATSPAARAPAGVRHPRSSVRKNRLLAWDAAVLVCYVHLAVRCDTLPFALVSQRGGLSQGGGGPVCTRGQGDPAPLGRAWHISPAGRLAQPVSSLGAKTPV